MSVDQESMRKMKLYSQAYVEEETRSLSGTASYQAAQMVRMDATIKQRDSEIFHLKLLLEERGINAEQELKRRSQWRELSQLRADNEELKQQLKNKDHIIEKLMAKLQEQMESSHLAQSQQNKIAELNQQLEQTQRLLNKQSSLGQVGNLLQQIGDPGARKQESERKLREEAYLKESERNRRSDEHGKVYAQLYQLKGEVARLYRQQEQAYQQAYSQTASLSSEHSQVVEYYKERILAQQAEIQRLTQALAEQRYLVYQARMGSDGKKGQCEALQREIQKLQTQVSKLTSEIAGYQYRNALMETQLKELEENRDLEVAQLVNQITYEKQTYVSTLEREQQQAAELEQSNYELAQYNTRLQEQNKLYEEKIHEIVDYYDYLLNDNEVISASLVQMERSTMQSNDRIDVVLGLQKEKVVLLSQQLLEQDLRLARAETLCQSLLLQAQSAGLQPKLEQSIVEHARSLAKRCYDSHDDLEVSLANYYALGQQIEEYMGALAGANRQIMGMFSEIRALRAQLTQLKTMQIESDHRLKTSQLINQELEMRLSTTQ